MASAAETSYCSMGDRKSGARPSRSSAVLRLEPKEEPRADVLREKSCMKSTCDLNVNEPCASRVRHETDVAILAPFRNERVARTKDDPTEAAAEEL